MHHNLFVMCCMQIQMLCFQSKDSCAQESNQSLANVFDAVPIITSVINSPPEAAPSQEIRNQHNYYSNNNGNISVSTNFVSDSPTIPPVSAVNTSSSATLLLWRSHAWFTENHIELVNSHWFDFPPPPRAAHYLLAAVYTVIMSAGIFGNLLVIFMFVKCRSLRTPANILVTNLAVSDLAMMLKIPIFIYNSIYEGYALGDIGCKIYGFVGGLTGTESICTLAAIALDRYYVIVYPLNRTSTTLRSKICIAVTWIYSSIFASIPLLNLQFGTFVPEGYLTSCSFDYLSRKGSIKMFILCYFIAAWLIPFIIISLCYSKILWVVVRSRNIGNKMHDPGISGRQSKEQEQKKKEIRLALVVFAIIGLWFVAWTPYAIIALLGIAGQNQLITPLSSMIPALFCKTSSCLDPFIYAVTNQKFKEELKTIFCKQRVEGTKTGWATSMSKQATIRDTNDDDVEDDMVMVEPLRNCSSGDDSILSAKKGIGRSLVQPVTNISNEVVNISDIGKKNRGLWVLRPSFSNRSSSVRVMARTWNRSKEY